MIICCAATCCMRKVLLLSCALTKGCISVRVMVWFCLLQQYFTPFTECKEFSEKAAVPREPNKILKKVIGKSIESRKNYKQNKNYSIYFYTDRRNLIITFLRKFTKFALRWRQTITVVTTSRAIPSITTTTPFFVDQHYRITTITRYVVISNMLNSWNWHWLSLPPSPPNRIAESCRIVTLLSLALIRSVCVWYKWNKCVNL